MKKTLIIALAFTFPFAQAQKVDKYITEKNVARVISILAADDMMGRSASRPEHIDKAAAFIASEFKSIGLKPLSGLKGFRQEFQKERVSPLSATATIDGETIASENIIVVSEQKQIDVKGSMTVKTIAYDSAAAAKDQFYFLRQAFGITRDTASVLVLVAPEYENAFKQLKNRYGARFTRGDKSTKVFVLGKTSATDFTIKANQKIDNISMSNVVGVLEGKSKKEELVVFSGHYDHIGIQRAVNGDSIANGADDDASGTTAVIELARYFAKMKNNNRTLIFVAFTAEEIGGFGSQHFSRQLDADKVVAMFNIEMIGKPSKWGQNSAFITGWERSDFGEILQKNLKGTPFEFKPDPYPEQNLFYRSDNATLARQGVPAHSISTDQIDIDKLYHTVDDEVESLDMKNITSTIRAIALSSRTIVDGTDTPKRIDKSTVR